VPLAHVARRLVQQAEDVVDLKRGAASVGDQLDAWHDLVLRVADKRAVDLQPGLADALLRALEWQALGGGGEGVRLQQIVQAHLRRQHFGQFSSLLTVKTLTGMTTDVYPRENFARERNFTLAP